MHPDDFSGPGLATRRGLLKALGAGGAAATIGVSPSVAADGDQACSGSVPPELIGRFVDTYGHRHMVDETHWLSTHDDEEFLYRVCAVQPQAGFLIAQNDGSQTYHPDKFSRFEWMFEDGDIWYCQQVFSADSHEEAADFARFPAAGNGNPGHRGCGESGTFAWTKLTAEPTE